MSTARKPFEPDSAYLADDGFCQISLTTPGMGYEPQNSVAINTNIPYDIDSPSVQMTTPVKTNFKQLKDLALGLYFTLVEIETGVLASDAARMEFKAELFSSADRASENYYITAKTEEKQRRKKKKHGKYGKHGNQEHHGGHGSDRT